MTEQPDVGAGQTCAPEAQAAAQDLYEAIGLPDAALAICFCASAYDLEALGAELSSRFAGVPLVGCTTAGEIGPSGWCDHSLCGVGLSRQVCSAVAGRMGDLQEFTAVRGHAFITALRTELLARAPGADPSNTFGIVLVDGLSGREDQIARVFQSALGNIRLIGGSAGDAMHFSCTFVYFDGEFHPNSAAVMLATTTLPFRTFKTQHFVCDEDRMVVTEADSTNRRVREINGRPAAEEYARLTGVDAANLEPADFAVAPLVVRVGGEDYVRSIRERLPDGSLQLYCSVDEGLVLRIGRGGNMVEDLDHALSNIQREIGPPLVVLGCDCVLRQVEAIQTGVKAQVEELMKRHNVVGFATYGEEYHGVHVNQTFVGLAIGAARETPDA